MASDLCTLADVRAFLQKPASDTGQDAITSSIITRASAAVMRYTEREFVTTVTNPASRTFEYEGYGWLNLAPYDIQSVTQVVDVTDGQNTTVGTQLWRLWPYPAQDGVYTALRLDVFPSTTRWRQRLIQVTGTWGFPSVPDDVKHWTIVTAALWLRREVQAFSTTFNLDEARAERPEELPAAARAGLGRWKRMVMS